MFQTDAYIINITIQKEADAIISFLTPLGYKQAYIRGVMRLKSKMRILTNRLAKVRINYQETPNYIKVKEVKLLEYPNQEVLNYQTNLHLSKICRDIIQTKHLDHQATYIIFNELMHNTEQLKHYHQLILANITLSLGVNFSLDCCARCQNTKNIISFDLYEGGYLCRNCAENREQLSLEALRTINQLFKNQVTAFLSSELDNVFSLKLIDFIDQTYGYKLSWE